MLDDLALQKLALARHLLGRATAAAAESGFLGPAVGVSLAQDAIELILVAAAEQLHVRVTSTMSFEGLITEIGKKGSQIPEPTRLHQINKARVGFKHHGIPPEPQLAKKLVSFSAIAADEICRECFGVSLWSVASTQLVGKTRVRNYLNEALRLKDAGRFAESVRCSAIAFALTFGGLSNSRARRSSARRVGDIGFSGVSRPDNSDLQRSISALARATEHDLEQVDTELNRLEDQLHSVRLGIDLDQLAKFEAMVPTVRFTRAGMHHTTWFTQSDALTSEEADFAFDFAFDAVLRYRQTDDLQTDGADEIVVIEPTPIIVYPVATGVETIRIAQSGERFRRPRPLREELPGFRQIVLEGDRCFISSEHSNIIPVTST